MPQKNDGCGGGVSSGTTTTNPAAASLRRTVACRTRIATPTRAAARRAAARAAEDDVPQRGRRCVLSGRQRQPRRVEGALHNPEIASGDGKAISPRLARCVPTRPAFIVHWATTAASASRAARGDSHLGCRLDGLPGPCHASSRSGRARRLRAVAGRGWRAVGGGTAPLDDAGLHVPSGRRSRARAGTSGTDERTCKRRVVDVPCQYGVCPAGYKMNKGNRRAGGEGELPGSAHDSNQQPAALPVPQGPLLPVFMPVHADDFLDSLHERYETRARPRIRSSSTALPILLVLRARRQRRRRADVKSASPRR